MSRIVTKEGRVFVLAGEEPYQRKDGTMTTLRVWQSNCDRCGAPFEVKTPAAVNSLDGTKSFGLKHCKAHRLSPAESAARGRKALRTMGVK